jgi:hypothetical protein
LAILINIDSAIQDLIATALADTIEYRAFEEVRYLKDEPAKTLMFSYVIHFRYCTIGVGKLESSSIIAFKAKSLIVFLPHVASGLCSCFSSLETKLLAAQYY